MWKLTYDRDIDVIAATDFYHRSHDHPIELEYDRLGRVSVVEIFQCQNDAYHHLSIVMQCVPDYVSVVNIRMSEVIPFPPYPFLQPTCRPVVFRVYPALEGDFVVQRVRTDTKKVIDLSMS